MTEKDSGIKSHCRALGVITINTTAVKKSMFHKHNLVILRIMFRTPFSECAVR